MGVRLLLAVVLALLSAASADAAPRAKTRFDGIRDCEQVGRAQFLRHDPSFKRFVIDRAKVAVDKFADRVSAVFVSTIYHGTALYEAGSGPHTTRFICLHGGVERDALFVYTVPE